MGRADHEWELQDEQAERRLAEVTGQSGANGQYRGPRGACRRCPQMT